MLKKLGSIFILFISLNSYATPSHPTIILVHGALLTSSIWAPVQSTLQNRGVNVITVDTPGRVGDGVVASKATLSAATAKICKVAELQPKPVLLAAHSQAGAVITQAVQQCGQKIAGLVYIAAVVPLSGEKSFDLLSEKDIKNFDQGAPLNEKTGVSTPNLQSAIKELFIGSDVNQKEATRAVDNMVPESITLGDEKLKYNADMFNRIPKFYIKTAKDQIVSPETQNKYIQRQHFVGIYTLNTGHAPFVTQPQQLALLLEKIDKSL